MSKSDLPLKNKLQGLRCALDSPDLISEIEKCIDFRSYAVKEPSLFNQKAKLNIRKFSLLIAKELAATELVDLPALYKRLNSRLFSFGVESEVENFHLRHMMNQLSLLLKKPNLKKQILQLKLPLMNLKIENLIRKSINLNTQEKLTSKHIQELCLSAFFTPLRQSVGSCFATAPAILVQKEQPELFFQDLEDLLNMGLIKRTFAGHEHSIPLSPSWGVGSLDQPFLFSIESTPWQTYEMKSLFHSLFPESSSEEEIKKIIVEKLKIEDREILTLNLMIKKILLFKYGLAENEIKKSHRALSTLNLIQGNLSASSSKIESYKEETRKAQLHLIQLEEHLFLKSWEYTLASFSESESEFYKWNLFTALGFNSDEENGIGKAIYHYLQDKMEQNNQEIERLNQEYEQEYFRVKYLEKRVQDVESDRLANWARIEYQNHLNDLNRLLHNRDKLIDKTNQLAKLLPKLITKYEALFPRYFQELYDAQMHDYSKGIYEDSPAGFRLIFKHGRTDSSLWTFVENKDEFLDILKSFFTLTEVEIFSSEELCDFEKEILEIGTLIVKLIYSDDFMKGAFSRIAKRYQYSYEEIEDFDRTPYKPWSYISGGTMKGLLTNYFKREGSFHEEHKKVTSPTELLSFLIDTVRLFPKKEIEVFFENPDKSLLMTSPTHAFLFQPGWMPLKEIWENKTYSYTWIRDEIIQPQVSWLNSIEVSPSQTLFFLQKFTASNPYLYIWFKENVIWPNYSVSLKDFAQLIKSSLSQIPRQVSGFSISEEIVDSWIYQCFPLTHSKELRDTLIEIGQDLSLHTSEKITSNLFSSILDLPIQSSFIDSIQLFSICKAHLLIGLNRREDEINWPYLIMQVMRERGLAMPKPLIFADTNWPYYYFAFVVSPSSHQLELWRVDPLAREGFSMKVWDPYFSEEEPRNWSIFTRSNEYEAGEVLSFYKPV